MFFNKDMVAGTALICTSTPEMEIGSKKNAIKRSPWRLHFQEVLFADMFFNKEMVTGTAIICTSTPEMEIRAKKHWSMIGIIGCKHPKNQLDEPTC
jgi:hypothetical protein